MIATDNKNIFQFLLFRIQRFIYRKNSSGPLNAAEMKCQCGNSEWNGMAIITTYNSKHSSTRETTFHVTTFWLTVNILEI